MKNISRRLLKSIHIKEVLEELKERIEEREEQLGQMLENQEIHKDLANKKYLRFRKAYRYLELLKSYPHTLKQLEQLVVFEYKKPAVNGKLFQDDPPPKKKSQNPPQHPN